MVNTDSKKIREILERGVEEVIEKKSLEEKLKSGKRLTVKFGADPTAPDLHLGHSVCLQKLKEFQDLGHKIVFIIGDFTAMIGDPSGRIKTRPPLSPKEIERNTKTYLEQAGKILDLKKTETLKNSKWLSKIDLERLLKLAGKLTVARILERNDFEKRMEAGIEIGFHEIIYPILQAYDSVMIKADVEIGGSDQRFNLLFGRDLQQKMGQAPQDIIILPLLLGLDGKQKMSKSFKNYVGITEKPEEQYGKIMSIPDSLILHYFELVTKVSAEDLEQIRKDLANPQINPRDIKARLAREIVTIYHGAKMAKKAEEEFNKVFREHKIPEEILACKIQAPELNILDLLVESKLAPSKAEAKRLVQQGGVKLKIKNEKLKIKNWREVIKIENGMVIQVGKRKFVRIIK